MVLAAVLPGQEVAGKQHRRTRIGYLAAELPELARHLAGAELNASVACRLDPLSPWETVEELRKEKTRQTWEILLFAELPGTDGNTNLAAAARAVVP